MPTYTTASLQSYFEPRVEQSPKNPLYGATDAAGVDPNPNLPQIHGAYVTPMRCGEPEMVDFDSRNGVGYLHQEEVGENFETFDIDEDKEVSGFQGADCNGKDQTESCSCPSAQGEFFDANDEFSSDGSTSRISSYGSRNESELNTRRLFLLEEIERRKNVEEKLTLVQDQWVRISGLMHQAGLTFPGPPSASGSTLFDDMMDLFSQEVLVSRFVAEAVGRGQASAEAGEATVSIIESKNQEISRLHDRLQYYETVNHEMSQRNFVEVARRRKERKRTRRRWLWTIMGFSIAIGTSLVAYSYIPLSSKYVSLLTPTDAACSDPHKTS